MYTVGRVPYTYECERSARLSSTYLPKGRLTALMSVVRDRAVVDCCEDIASLQRMPDGRLNTIPLPHRLRA